MRTLEVRRHAATKKGKQRGRGSHLSQAGVDAARHLGDSIGPFALVVASTVPRSSETALAMGFVVDECMPMGGPHFEEASREIAHHEWWEVPDPFAMWKDHIERGGAVAALAADQESFWRRVVQEVPDDAAALVISHGGLIEPGLLVCFPRLDHATWGRPFGNLDGARLGFDRDRWVGVELLRIAPA